MRFVRHLAAVLALLTVIVGLCLVWEHASGGSARSPAPARISAPSPGSHSAVRLTLWAKEGALVSGFGFRNYADLARTVLVEAALIGIVAAFGGHRHRRRRRRQRRRQRRLRRA